MSKLKIADDLSLPLDVVTQTISILAKRRAGKSYAMRRLVEQLFKAGQQIIMVDPKGDQWGLRSTADGKAPGLPIVILGGERGDVPLEANSGEIVAKLVVEERVSILLDLSLFRKHEVATFMTAFLENLYRLKAREIYRTPVMLVIDEADAVAPQKPQKGEERMLGAAEDIVRRGGQRGIGCVLVTQRSAVLNKNVLTQTQMLIVLRTIAPQDLAAMDLWIDVHGEPEQRKTLMESLPSLPIGDAWFWSPGWPTNKGIFKRVHVLPIETFDSGATPKPGQKHIEPKNLADVDLDALKGQMAATIEKAKADNPKELRKRINELEKMLKQAQGNKPETKTEIKRIEVPTIKKHELKWLKECARELGVGLKKIGEIHQKNRDIYDAWTHNLDLIGKNVGHLTASLDNLNKPTSITATIHARQPIKPQTAAALRDMVSTVAHAAGSNGIDSTVNFGKGERRILIAIAQHQEGVMRKQITVLTGYKRSSRDTYLQRLRALDYIVFNGETILATEAGIAVLGHDFEPLPTGDALKDYWLNRLSGGEKAILEKLISAYPSGVLKNELDEATGYQRSSRDTYIHRLRSRKLITDSHGIVRAADLLFPV